jgi:hypothetical protein
MQCPNSALSVNDPLRDKKGPWVVLECSGKHSQPGKQLPVPMPPNTRTALSALFPSSVHTYSR